MFWLFLLIISLGNGEDIDEQLYPQLANGSPSNVAITPLKDPPVLRNATDHYLLQRTSLKQLFTSGKPLDNYTKHEAESHLRIIISTIGIGVPIVTVLILCTVCMCPCKGCCEDYSKPPIPMGPTTAPQKNLPSPQEKISLKQHSQKRNPPSPLSGQPPSSGGKNSAVVGKAPNSKLKKSCVKTSGLTSSKQKTSKKRDSRSVLCKLKQSNSKQKSSTGSRVGTKKSSHKTTSSKKMKL